MSSANTLILNCGATHVSASTFIEQGGQLTLQSYAVEPLDYDFAEEEQWLGALGGAVRRLSAQGKTKGTAQVIAPGFQLLTKTLKVAHVEAARQAQVIAFEAARNIPYPLAEVVWDYEVVMDDGIEVEVLLIFVKRDAIEGLCRTLTAAGVTPGRVQAGPLLDYAAYRHTHQGDQPDTILVNIGARSTNLLFINDSGYFIRTISLGGNSLTQNISDNLGRPFGEAERLKIDKETQDDGTGDSAMQTIIQNNADSYMKRLGQEIRKSVVNYRRQREAKAPERILLTGRGALLDGIAEHLSTSQKIPVEIFDPLTAINLAGSVNVAAMGDFAHTLTEVIGEAARMALPECPSVDLLPQSLASEMRFAKQKPWFVAAAALLAAAAVPPWLSFQQQAAICEEDCTALRGNVAPLQARFDEILQTERDIEIVSAKIAKLDRLVKSRSNWIAFLADLQNSLQEASHVWLEELSWDEARPDRLDIKGRLLVHEFNPDNPEDAYRGARQRVNSLMSSFVDSDFVADVTNERFDNSNPRILGFEFTFVINPDTAL